jgi:hypothetical protein
MAPLSFILTMFLPESPRYYYEKRDMVKLRQEFENIAKFNNQTMPENYEFVLDDGTVVDDDNKDNRYVHRMLKDRSTLMNLAVMLLTYAAISFDTNLLSYHSKYFKANGYDMAFLMLHSDIIGTAVALVLRK